MRILYIICIVLLGAAVHAQERIVSGNVVDDQNTPLPGVNIIVKGTTKGLITDIEGKYRISAEAKDTLVFSFVGMKTHEETVGIRSTINIQLEPDSKTLSEVLVVAYGEESKRSLTGAVASIDANVIERQQVTSITRSLSGTVPGVSVISSNGQPGNNPTIRIRGTGSIDSDNSPLIVLDGSVYSSNINTIPASDIESISVLKDASAAALYGSRAANGVIVITTKKGKFSGGKWSKPNINFSMTMGVSERAVKEYEYVDAKTAMRMEWEALKNDAIDDKNANPGQAATDGLLKRVGYNPFGGDKSPIDSKGNFISENLLWDTDWLGALLTNTALRQDYNLNLSGGSNKFNYFLGGNILRQDGQLFNSNFKRYTGRLNVDIRPLEWLTVGIKQSISSSEQNNPFQSGTTYSNTIQWSRTVSNIYPLYRRDENGKLIRDNTGNLIYDTGDGGASVLNSQRPPLSPGNTVALLRLNKYLYKRLVSLTNASLKVHFLKNFTAKTNYQFNNQFFNGFSYSNPSIGSARTVKGRITRFKNTTSEWTWTNSLSWKKTYGDHNINALVLQELYSYMFEYQAVRGTGLPFGGLYEINSTATPESINGYTDLERISSLMTRIKYNYRNKYFVEGSYRRDQSSRFSPETRNGNFYSIAGSWLLTEEPFLKKVIPVLNFMKIRVSYGELGNSRIQDSDASPLRVPNGGRGQDLYFPYLPTYQTGYDQLSVPGIYPTGLTDRSLTWESVATLNIGLDFGLFQDRLTGTVDLYSAITKGLVTGLSTIPSRGIRGNKIVQNIGDVTNSGIEVTLAGTVLKSRNFTWHLQANIAFEKNVITKFPEKERVNGSKKLVEGRSIYDFWIREYAGVDPTDGKPMWWVDSMATDKKTVLFTRSKTTKDYDNASRNFVGTALPWARGGVSSRMDFKGFDLSVLVNFSLGGKILDSDYARLMHGGQRAGQQYSTDILKRWQAAGDITNVPRLSSTDRGNSILSTRFLFDATYARIRNITLGYSLPPSVLNKLGGVIKSFRIFFSGDNLFTFFGRKGLDPEQAFTGTTDDRSSIMKTYSGGLELKF